MEKKTFATCQHLLQMLHQFWCNVRASIWVWIYLALPGAIIFTAGVVVDRVVIRGADITRADSFALFACLVMPKLFHSIWKRFFRSGESNMVVLTTVCKDESGDNLLVIQIGEGGITFGMPSLVTRIALLLGILLVPEVVVTGLIACILVIILVSYAVVTIVALTLGVAEVILQIRDALGLNRS